MLRSLKGIYKASAVGAWFGLGPSPDPGPGAGVELGGRHPGGVGDLAGVGEGLPGQRLAAEDPPPGFLQVQPAGAVGMKAWRMRGWSSSQAWVLLLLWLERLSVIT